MDDFNQGDGMDNGHVMAGIVIDDYEEYDEEYFGEDDDGTFNEAEGQEKEDDCGVSNQMTSDELKNEAANSEQFRGNFITKDSEGTTEVEEEVDEIEDEVVEEENEEYERFNRTEVAEPRQSLLSRLGPKPGGETASVATPSPAPVGAAKQSSVPAGLAAGAKPTPAPAITAAASKAMGNKFSEQQNKNIHKRLIYMSNLPSTCTIEQVKGLVSSKLKGYVKLELFDGIYKGCAVAGISSFTAVKAVAHQMQSNPVNGCQIQARMMTLKDHGLYWSQKMQALTGKPTNTAINDQNVKWLVVLRNIAPSTTDAYLLNLVKTDVPAVLKLHIARDSNNPDVSGQCFVVMPTKLAADTLCNKFDERLVHGKQLMACPYYRGHPALKSSSKVPGGPITAAEKQREMQQRAAAVKQSQSAGPQQQQGGAGPGGKDRSPATPAVHHMSNTIKLNSLRELLQRTKGCQFRVAVHNVAYQATEDDIIQAVDKTVGGLQYILPFRNNQGCFNGIMLLEFNTTVAARKCFQTMQKFRIKSRQIFLKMDTDAPRDPQGKVLDGSTALNPNLAGGQMLELPNPMSGVPPHPHNHNPLDFGPVDTMLGARLEPPMLPPHPAHVPFGDDLCGFSLEFLDRHNIGLPLVNRLLITNVDPRATENAVGDLLSLAGKVTTVQCNRLIDQAIVEMSHPVEAVEAIARLHNHPFFERTVGVRLLRPIDFDVFNGIPLGPERMPLDMPSTGGMIPHDQRMPPVMPDRIPDMRPDRIPDMRPDMIPDMRPGFDHPPPSNLRGFDPLMADRVIPDQHVMPPFRAPNGGESSDALASDDLRSRLTRTGNRGRGAASGPPAAAATRGGPAARGSTPPNNLGGGRGSPNNRGAANNMSGGRGSPNNLGGGRGSPNNLGIGRGTTNNLGNGRGGSNSASSDRGGANSPGQSSRGAASNARAGRGAATAGRGAATAGRGAATAGRGAATAGRGAATAGRGAAIAGRGAATVARGATTAGRGATPAARGAATVATAGRGAATAGRGATASRGATTATTPGRGATTATTPSRGAGTVGRGAATAATPGRGAATATTPGRGAATAATPGRGAATATTPGRGAATAASVRGASVAGRGASLATRGSPIPTRGASVAARGASAAARGASVAGRGASAATRGSPIATRGASVAARGATSTATPGRGASVVGRGGGAAAVATRGSAAGTGRGGTNAVGAGRGAATSVPGRGAATAGRGTATGGVAAGGRPGANPGSTASSTDSAEKESNNSSSPLAGGTWRSGTTLLSQKSSSSPSSSTSAGAGNKTVTNLPPPGNWNNWNKSEPEISHTDHRDTSQVDHVTNKGANVGAAGTQSGGRGTASSSSGGGGFGWRSDADRQGGDKEGGWKRGRPSDGNTDTGGKATAVGNQDAEPDNKRFRRDGPVQNDRYNNNLSSSNEMGGGRNMSSNNQPNYSNQMRNPYGDRASNMNCGADESGKSNAPFSQWSDNSSNVPSGAAGNKAWSQSDVRSNFNNQNNSNKPGNKDYNYSGPQSQQTSAATNIGVVNTTGSVPFSRDYMHKPINEESMQDNKPFGQTNTQATSDVSKNNPQFGGQEASSNYYVDDNPYLRERRNNAMTEKNVVATENAPGSATSGLGGGFTNNKGIGGYAATNMPSDRSSGMSGNFSGQTDMSGSRYGGKSGSGNAVGGYGNSGGQYGGGMNRSSMGGGGAMRDGYGGGYSGFNSRGASSGGAGSGGGYGYSKMGNSGTRGSGSSSHPSRGDYNPYLSSSSSADSRYGGSSMRGPAQSSPFGMARSSSLFGSQSTKLILNNLPIHIHRGDIMSLCGSYGVVRDVDLDTKQFKCRVMFESVQQAATAARELNDRVYRGSTLRAIVA